MIFFFFFLKIFKFLFFFPIVLLGGRLQQLGKRTYPPKKEGKKKIELNLKILGFFGVPHVATTNNVSQYLQKISLEYGDVLLSLLTFIVNPTMNLISEIRYECKRREHHVTVFWEYLIYIYI